VQIYLKFLDLFIHFISIAENNFKKSNFYSVSDTISTHQFKPVYLPEIK